MSNGAYRVIRRSDNTPSFSVQNYFIAAANQRERTTLLAETAETSSEL